MLEFSGGIEYTHFEELSGIAVIFMNVTAWR
jgi:hypothetical protein